MKMTTEVKIFLVCEAKDAHTNVKRIKSIQPTDQNEVYGFPK